MKFVHLLGATTLAASMLGTLAAHAQEPPKPTAPAAATAAPDPEAKKQFDAGVAYLEDPDGAKYEDAYRSFKKAYEISQSPKVLGNVGFCAMHLERDGEAIDAYATYLREVKEIDERERKQIERDLTTMTATIARLKVTVKRPGTSFVLVDTREQVRGGAILNEYPLDGNEVSLRVRPGRHTLKVRAGDEDSDPVVLTVDPGGTITQEMKWTPKPVAGVAAPEKSSYVGPAILTALGAAGIGAGVVTGILAKSKQHNLRDSCNAPNNGTFGADTCPPDYKLSDKRSSAKTFADISTTAYIAGPVVLGVGVVWGVVNYVRNKNLMRKGSTDPTWLVGGGCAREGCSMNFTRGF